VRHQHRPGDPFAPNVASTSLSPDERAAVQLSDGIVFTVDLEFEVDLGSNPQLTPELSWSPILEQGGGSMQVPSRSR
jgi:hypothetical protein